MFDSAMSDCHKITSWREKNKEIAEEMGISVITVKSHKMMAYKELRKILAHSVSFILLVCLKSIGKRI